MSRQITDLDSYKDCARRVSAEVERAVVDGKINASCFVDFTNNARRLALGLYTVMQLLHANRLAVEAAADGEGQPMFSDFEEGNLFGLAETSLWLLVSEADGHASWAEAHLKRMEGKS